jgi:hypothetical protein
MNERRNLYVPNLFSTTQLTAFQASLDSPLSRPLFRVDPLSRCAALSLPKDAIAILPFIQTQVDLDVMDQDQQNRYITLINSLFVPYRRS